MPKLYITYTLGGEALITKDKKVAKKIKKEHPYIVFEEINIDKKSYDSMKVDSVIHKFNG
jgi:hypothetical protein